MTHTLAGHSHRGAIRVAPEPAIHQDQTDEERRTRRKARRTPAIPVEAQPSI
ncbi:MAG: hypothetical protein KGO51_15945 [Alphaproteobacteria bacterium]|nr:hypothetical protein [Alphaproteobacteria bacterium]